MGLHTLLHPTSVAVIGASRDPRKIGNIVLTNLQKGGYTGSLYPINPQAKEINQLPTYSHITTLPEIPDLCIISLPVQILLQTLEEAIQYGCTTYIIFTAGFKEAGPEGEAIEQQLKELATKSGVTLLGPNCLGCIHLPSKLNATFAKADMQEGELLVISQSGAIASALFDWSTSVHVGLQSCLTIGNKATLSEQHILEYRKKTSNPHAPIALYLEEIENGKAFTQITKELSQTHPVILLKPGKSSAAQHAMQSHTGSLAGDDRILDAACAQANIMRTQTLEEFFDLCMYFSRQKAPRGNRIALVTNAGGPGVITTDHIEAAGLTTAQPSDQIKQLLAEQLPRAASVNNPVDILGDAPAERYRVALEAIITDTTDIDAIVVLLTPQVMTQIKETAEVIIELSKTHDIPIICSFIGDDHVNIGKKLLREHHIPCYAYPNQAIDVLSAAVKWQQKNDKKRTYKESAKNILPKKDNHTSTSDKRLWSREETEQLFKKYAILTPPTKRCLAEDELLSFVEEHSYPVTMKMQGGNLVHKIDTGGVITNITDETQLRSAWKRLKKLQEIHTDTYIYIQQHIGTGVECIVGIKYDPSFGHVLLFGLGGTYTDLFPHKEIRLLPLERPDIKKMIEQSACAPFLLGYRGKKALHIDSLITCIEQLILLATKHNELEQIEINPIIVTEQATRAVDPKCIS